MHIVYGLTEGNERAAESLYRKRHSKGRPRRTGPPSMEPCVLDTVQRNPSTMFLLLMHSLHPIRKTSLTPLLAMIAQVTAVIQAGLFPPTMSRTMLTSDKRGCFQP
ncbi:hypothetical protein TNCV_556511 [Trichonephila clavipes]|uniref:DUF4817 domain-containing protein n=1 Tax=Trichonephila clavipes TaxID=2585209 RepID=A0A8X6RTD6_TRICX|nr:hypothetical protein TNCV_556511 [Trichonephila clavipes]